MAHRFFAWLYPKIMGPHEAHLVDRKRRLFADLEGTVLEVGPGTGANLALLPANTTWIGIEPNPYMHSLILAEAARLGRAIELRAGSVEQIDMPDASVDAVVATLVFCSVASPERGLAEIRRVLKPGSGSCSSSMSELGQGPGIDVSRDSYAPAGRFSPTAATPTATPRNISSTPGSHPPRSKRFPSPSRSSPRTFRASHSVDAGCRSDRRILARKYRNG